MILEELLNKLIKRGWIPFDVKGVSEYFFESVPVGQYRLCWKKPDYDYNVYSKRELVSKESGLWQFVCENGMVFIPKGEIPHVERNYIFDYECYEVSEFQYWLMVGALLKEDEIEQFLLDNIKVEGH